MAAEGNQSKVEESFLVRFERELNNENNFFVPPLAKLEKLTKVKRTYLAYGVLGFLALYLVLGRGAQFVCNALSFGYPAIQSLKALESSSKDDDTKWLIYWVTFATFSVVESGSDILLSWIPFYFLLKLVFLVFCSFPIERNGSYYIYTKFIRPVFLRNQAKIDNFLNNAAVKTFGAVQTVYNEGKKFASKDE